MPTTDQFLTFRGDIQALTCHDRRAIFVTVHAEKQPTAVYFLDAETADLTSQEFPAGGRCLTIDPAGKAAEIWIGDTAGQLYRTTASAKKPSAVGKPSDAGILALALLSESRIAALSGTAIHILARKDGKILQTLELPDAGTVITADPTGEWLVAGTGKGQIFVFECEDKDEFLLSESDKLHNAAVTALLFEPEELRFYSAGADQKLLLTHARGTLEPEDRGRANVHSEPITAMVLTGDDRFLTGSGDRTLKSWQRGGGTRPSTQKDGVGSVIDLGIVTIHSRQHAVVGCEDNTLRFFLLDASGKVGDLSFKVHDAYTRSAQELSANETARREAALNELASYGDTKSLEMIASQIERDADHAVRVLATDLVTKSGHPRAIKILEDCLKHKDEAVRRAAFAGLIDLTEPGNFRPLDLALDANRADVGVEAVSRLESLAKKDDRALTRLEKSLDRKNRDVRRAALLSLEAVFAKDAPDAELRGLKSQHADVRKLSLVRFLQRQMLGNPSVQSALRRAGEDSDADVRRTAFLISLLTREKLADAVRARDQELHRQLFELESFELDDLDATSPDAAKKSAKKAKKTARVAVKKKTAASAKESETPKKTKALKLPKTTIKKLDLAPADYEPLLQAMASRELDTCLLGGRCLALLGDPRALGLLLQLSREDEASARVEVCRALAQLNDSRAVDRLRTLLDDKSEEVRDAAFTAVAAIHAKEPIEAAEAGLNASQEDVRRRGLQALVDVVRKSSPKTADDPKAELLLRALNDNFLSVRSEAFKACLNQQVLGGDGETLRFVLNSLHADTRRDVLTEVMANIKHDWAGELLYELYNDPDAEVRKEAFDFAVKKAKPSDLEPLTEALDSRYADIRLEGVNGLIKKRTKKAQAELKSALADPELTVRQAALEALVGSDATDAVTQAMESSFLDVRLRAAGARARLGDASALKPLQELVAEPEPQDAERHKAWALTVEHALKSLGELGDPVAFDAVGPKLDNAHAKVRKAAAIAMVQLAREDLIGSLKSRLQHDDKEVKYRAALALAFCGESQGAALVFSEKGAGILKEISQITAAVTLGEIGEDRIGSFLDHGGDTLRLVATLTLLARDWKLSTGTPQGALAGLSSKYPRVRLVAAQALENYPDSHQFAAFILNFLNEKGDEPAWDITAETLSAVADVTCFASRFVQARLFRILPLLAEDKQAAWNLEWSVFKQRFAKDIQAATKAAGKHKPAKVQTSAEELRSLAFGTYVGLVREEWRSHGETVRLRQTALRRLQSLANTDDSFQAMAVPVQVQALSDPYQAVRFLAFDQLQESGFPAETLGAESIETGHTDLGVRGLKLITEGVSPAAGRKVLENVMISRTDELAREAAVILRENHNPVEIAARALESVWDKMRSQGIRWLAESYLAKPANSEEKTTAKKAREELVKALESRYREVRKSAAIELARKQDAAAFEPLSEFLKDRASAAIISALETLGDERAPEAFLDRVENDPAGDAPAGELIKAAGRFRQPGTVSRLLEMMERPKLRSACRDALRMIAGYDQLNHETVYLMKHDRVRGWVPRSAVEISQVVEPDWEQKQHPRKDDVLAQLIERCIDLGETSSLAELLEDARWSRGSEVDSVLATVASHSDDSLRRSAVEAIGWRLKHRDGQSEPLETALEHRDPETKFLAAEALAKAGNNAGRSILMSAIELMDDPVYRQRAVLALGELGDEQALDVLLKLANDDEHDLQAVATEALGHLGQSEQADEIFRMLEKYVKGSNHQLLPAALRGLRWFDTPSGWKLIREQADNPNFLARESAVELLGENDEPATRDLVLKLLRDDEDVIQEARTAALQLFGEDSLEPAYAILQNGMFWLYAEENEDLLKRVQEAGDPARIMEIFPRVDDVQREDLRSALLSREELPTAAALETLTNDEADVVALSAHILGRAGDKPTGIEKTLTRVISTWCEKWNDSRQKPATYWGEHPVTEVTPCLQRLVWAAGRIGVASEALLELATTHPDDHYFRPNRLEALRGLSKLKPTKKILDAIETAAVGPDPEARAMATQILSELDAKRATAVANQLLTDRVSLERLAINEGIDLTAAFQSAAESPHYQGVTLPLLITSNDLECLQALAHNADLPESARLGAIEALAELQSESAEEHLASLGKNEKEDEELRKAAWRARRRSKRRRSEAVAS